MHNIGSNADSLHLYHDWAKVAITLLGHSTTWIQGDFTAFQVAEEAEKIFEVNSSLKLQLTALAHMCNLSEHEPLVCERLAQKGLALASQFGLDKKRHEFEGILKMTSHHIQHLYYNRFLFLKSNPLKIRANNSSSPQLAGDFRSTVMGLLEQMQKDICVQFGVLTKQAFVDLHRKNNGCKVLVVDFYRVNREFLYLEDEGFGLHLLRPEDLDSIRLLLGDDFGPKIDVVVIMSKDASLAVSYFKHFAVKHFVYFDFTDLEGFTDQIDNEADFLVPFWIEELKTTFVCLFLEELTRNFTGELFSCLKHVQTECVDSVNHRLKDCKYIQCQVNHWKTDSIAVEKDLQFGQHHIIITGEAANKPSVSQFKEGTCKDISEPGWKQSEAPQMLLSRDQELLDIYSLLQSSKSRWVNLWGEYGVGKTQIVRQLQHEVRIRNLFPDGVFYFDLRTMDHSRSIRKQMGTVFSIEFLIDTNEFFKGKKMLIILDGYEKVLSGTLQTPVSLLTALAENSICTLFVTETDGPGPGKMREVPDAIPYQVNRLSDFQSLQFLLCYIALHFGTFLTFWRDSLDKFTHSTKIRECKGLPHSLKKNATRILYKGLGIKLEPLRISLSRTSFTSPKLQPDYSFSLDNYDFGSDLEDDLKSHPSVYASETGNLSSKDHKGPSMSKSKSKADSKKEGKQAKHKTKKKHKKEMH